MAVDANILRALVRRVSDLEAEKSAIDQDIAAIYAEAQAGGLDPEMVGECVRVTLLSEAERAEERQGRADGQDWQKRRAAYLKALGVDA